MRRGLISNPPSAFFKSDKDAIVHHNPVFIRTSIRFLDRLWAGTHTDDFHWSGLCIYPTKEHPRALRDTCWVQSVSCSNIMKGPSCCIPATLDCGIPNFMGAQSPQPQLSSVGRSCLGRCQLLCLVRVGYCLGRRCFMTRSVSVYAWIRVGYLVCVCPLQTQN